jgi:hypothetical protein
MVPSQDNVIARWVGALNGLRFSREAVAETDMRVTQWAGMLSSRFPAWAFCGRSLEHVAAKAVRADDYRDVTKALEDWMRENPDRAPRLPGSAAEAQLSEEDRVWLRRWDADPVEGAVPGARASLIRRQAPAAMRELVRSGRADARDEDAEDRAWWEGRMDDIRALPHPTQRWRMAMGMNATLCRPSAYPRPWAIGEIAEILREAVEAGADTDMAGVSWPRGHVPDMRADRADPHGNLGIAAE